MDVFDNFDHSYQIESSDHKYIERNADFEKCRKITDIIQTKGQGMAPSGIQLDYHSSIEISYKRNFDSNFHTRPL